MLFADLLGVGDLVLVGEGRLRVLEPESDDGRQVDDREPPRKDDQGFSGSHADRDDLIEEKDFCHFKFVSARSKVKGQRSKVKGQQ